jgi:BirA family biotin operon repressor/biotin-[acetyl-CoA-carboxylase] ligase
MAEAARRAPALAGPEWVLALAQTAARGRRGRAWRMPAGNFAATLVYRPRGSPADLALRSFAAALALAGALDEVTGQAGAVTLKWPNDVLLNGGKVAGILLESLPGGALSVGIGINLVAAPEAAEVEPGAVRPVSLQGETGVDVTPEAFLTPLATAYARWEATLAGQGFEPLRRAWLARAARLGQEITARTGSAVLQGRFETVDPSGHLVLATAQGRRAVPAADVFF